MWEARKQAGLTVALRKESVDRNLAGYAGRENRIWSLSARRAWIEMSSRLCCPTKRITVALRKESVDRNNALGGSKMPGAMVALRKESVDRNILAAEKCGRAEGRSPQGERG